MSNLISPTLLAAISVPASGAAPAGMETAVPTAASGSDAARFQSLMQAPLLNLHDRHWSAGAVQWHPLGWQEWGQAQGLTWQQPAFRLSTNKVALLTEAAVAGEGVMLGIHNLVQGHIARGELVYAHPAQLRSGRSNFMRINPVARRRPPVAHFASHLLCALQVH